MSDLATYQNWISPGFAWLDEHWPPEQTWDEVRPGFLDAVGVTDEDLSTAECRVLGILVHRADAMGDQQRRYALLAAEEREALLIAAFTQWQQEVPEDSAGDGDGAAEAPAEPEMQYVEGRGWMRYDQSTGEWVAVESEAGEAEAGGAGEGGAPQPDAGGATEPEWVEGHGWMRFDGGSGQWIKAEAPPGAEGTEVPPAPPMPQAQQHEAHQQEAQQHEAESHEGEAPPEAPPPMPQAQQHEAQQHEAESHEGEAPPEAPPPAPLSELSQEDQQDIVTAVEEAIAPAIEQVLAELEEDPDIDLSALSPEDIQEALAAALADPALNS